MRLRLLLELGIAILGIWYVYDTTGDSVQIVWTACFFLMMSLQGETFYLVRRVREKEARLRLDKIEMLPEYQDQAKDFRNVLGLMTTLVAAFTYFRYAAKLGDTPIWGTLAIFLLASLWAIIEWGRFLDSLRSLTRSVQSSFWMALFVLATSFVVTAAISAEIAKLMQVPFLFDTIAIFTPLIILSILERGLAEQLVLFQRIKSPSESLKELDKCIREIKQAGKMERVSSELEQTLRMQSKLQTALPAIEQMRGSVKKALQDKMQIEAMIRDQASIFRGLRKRAKERHPTIVLCAGRLYGFDARTCENGQVRGVDDSEKSIEFQDTTVTQKVIRTAALSALLKTGFAVLRIKLALRRLLILATSTLEDLLVRSFDELYAGDFSVWLSSEDLEVKTRKALSIDLHITGWQTLYARRKRLLIEEAAARLAISIRKYPICELVDAYLEQLRELLHCYHNEETLWIVRTEASRDFEEANPGSGTFLSRTSQRALDRIRMDLAKAESKHQSMFDKIQDLTGTRT